MPILAIALQVLPEGYPDAFEIPRYFLQGIDTQGYIWLLRAFLLSILVICIIYSLKSQSDKGTDCGGINQDAETAESDKESCGSDSAKAIEPPQDGMAEKAKASEKAFASSNKNRDNANKEKKGKN